MKKEFEDLLCLFRILTEDANMYNPYPLQAIYFKAQEKYNYNLTFEAIEQNLEYFKQCLLDYILVQAHKGYYIVSKEDNLLVHEKDKLNFFEIKELIKTLKHSRYVDKDIIIHKLIHQAEDPYDRLDLRFFATKIKK